MLTNDAQSSANFDFGRMCCPQKSSLRNFDSTMKLTIVNLVDKTIVECQLSFLDRDISARRDVMLIMCTITFILQCGGRTILHGVPDAPRYKTVTQPVKKTSPFPQPLHRGEQPRSEAVSIVAPGCRNCGRDHSLKNCPYIDCPGTNTDHSVDWVASKAGHSWKYWGYPSF